MSGKIMKTLACSSMILSLMILPPSFQDKRSGLTVPVRARRVAATAVPNL